MHNISAPSSTLGPSRGFELPPTRDWPPVLNDFTVTRPHQPNGLGGPNTRTSGVPCRAKPVVLRGPSGASSDAHIRSAIDSAVGVYMDRDYVLHTGCVY